LAAAIAARQRGFRVTVADGRTPPIDKACGEALMPDALGAFHQLGFAIRTCETRSLTGVRFLASGGISVEADFPAEFCGFSIRRTILHRMMVERATEMGVDLLWGAVVTGISETAVQVSGRTARTKWIVGADGVNSRVRAWAKLQAHSHSRLRYAFRRHYRVRPWSSRMEIHWGKSSQAYTSPVNDAEVCIAVASRDPALRLDNALEEFPELNRRLQGAEISSTERGAVSANRKLKRVWRNNVALIGDASGTVDAITGEGLGLAFQQALILAECMKAGDLRPYQAAHRKLALRPSLMARLMLTLDRRPALQRRTLQVFRRHPQLFERLLALHVGELSPYDLARDGVTLGWGLLRA
jgi:flavin-dependent dehydrogenase